MSPIKRGLVDLSTMKKPTLRKKVISPTTKNWLEMVRDEKFEDKRPLWGEVRTRGWRPSSLGDPCDRKTILGMFGYRGDPISTKLKRIFAMGNHIEDIWRDEFKAMGILLAANVRFTHDGSPGISGEYDLLVRHPYETNRRFVGEIKSINDRGFKKLPEPSLDPEVNLQALMNVADTGRYSIGPRIRKYMLQVQSYLYYPKVTDEGFILFDNKNTQDFLLYPINLTPDIILPESERLERLNEYRPKLLVPACTCVDHREGPCIVHTSEEIPLDELKALIPEVA